MTQSKPGPSFGAVVSDDGTVTPVTGKLDQMVGAALAPLVTVFETKKKRASKPRVLPKVASRGDAVEAPVKLGDKAPPKPEHGAAPVFYTVERDVPEPKLRVPPMPERLWTDSDESYKARVAKWAAAKDKARIAHEERLRVYHAGPKVRVEQVARWTRNPASPQMAPREWLAGTVGAGHVAKVAPSFEDRVTRLCVRLLQATDARTTTQALQEAGHDVVVAANREGMLVGKRLTPEGREHAMMSRDDFTPKPLKPVELEVSPETASCPICGHLVASFEAHLKARHLYPDKKSEEPKVKPKRAPARKAATKKAAKKAAESKAKKPRAKKSNPQPGKEEVHV